MTDTEYMIMAEALAEKALLSDDVPVGALVVRSSDGFIAGRGFNTREKEHTALGHAEIAAISEACGTLGGWRLRGCTLYVTLEPCPMCTGAAVSADIDRIVFGAYDTKGGACGSVIDLPAELHCRTAVRGGIRSDSCGEMLRAFFAEKRLHKSKVRLSDILTPDQIRRAASAGNIPESVIREDMKSGHKCCFIRYKGKPAGFISFKSNNGNISFGHSAVFDGYDSRILTDAEGLAKEQGGGSSV